MKRSLAAALLLTLPLAVFAAEPKAKQEPGSPSDPGEKFGLVFDLDGLSTGLNAYDDGYQAGLGFIWRFHDRFALRGLFSFSIVTEEDVTTGSAGLGVAGIWKPREKKAAPYLGILIGDRTEFELAATVFYLYGGILGGVEMRVWENIALFAEYKMVFSSGADGFTASLGADAGAVLGVVFYF